jgi:hypothetical protein
VRLPPHYLCHCCCCVCVGSIRQAIEVGHCLGLGTTWSSILFAIAFFHHGVDFHGESVEYDLELEVLFGRDGPAKK